MFYVILELDTLHQVETPKDHTRITKVTFQLVNANALGEVPTKVDQIVIDEQAESFKAAFEKLNESITSITRDSSFILCSLFSTWDIRVTLNRQARDLGVSMPYFLQYPKIFDLMKEYQRWCLNHPEVMSWKPKLESDKTINMDKKKLGLLELLTVLGLEDMYNFKEENDGAIDDKMFKNERDMTISTSVLLQLLIRCTTSDDTKNVLTCPYDSDTDVRSFLQERSRVLYMNNLPSDTTQSELESWFTQFGTRPVGFWTFKNVVGDTSSLANTWNSNNSPYVEELDSIPGFVVFQTHEEAIEVLALNGRAILSNVANTKQPRVVEHVVEIQPSSTSVLDKAHEILSSFPQSKNKPRPGDWSCPSCGFSNFQRRTACFRCSFPAPSNGHINIKSQNNSHHPEITSEHNTEGSQQNNTNRANASFNNSMYRYNTRYVNGSSYNQMNNNNHNNNTGSNIPFRAGDWNCASCTYHNFAKNVLCLRCGGPKTSTIYQQQNNNHNHGNNNNNINVIEKPKDESTRKVDLLEFVSLASNNVLRNISSTGN
ncbi:hypothetical protein KAFR_0B00870 [Kazachstania africana CBS 2517]|uniref:Asparagine-rich protein n=1 Tax=Kazachstania africana (strain ATCC 22294 / BCRC 22015 / CBS 2517 / CECT 1963 / NBRC 1671 / NRRL Y-8276) TaxID=1071382 RepID=H2APT5_KAZAF|nr:hypothetical protein KAFR_0B00870 [Kazachstania africana CBS 2517]CCF56385.1 hypothetical protein KAFR_0B00870 [Kazachstania africana CBS 2517]